MVRIRKQDGEVIEIPNSEAVEITGDDDRLALVILQDKERGATRVLIPGDPLFIGYCHTHGMKAAKVHCHLPTTLQPAPTGA